MPTHRKTNFLAQSRRVEPGVMRGWGGTDRRGSGIDQRSRLSAPPKREEDETTDKTGASAGG